MRQDIKKIFFYSFWLLKFSVFTVFFLIITIPLRFSKKYKNLWIISERPNEARDNGYWLYKWILENKPGTNIRYILSRDSADYDKMPRKELIIEPNSARHYIYYILSSYAISTHMHGACPGKSFCIPFLPFMRKKKNVFLQHGVTKNAVKFRSCLDVIIAVSEEEKELIEKTNKNYVGKVYLGGFCRYDHLKDTSSAEKQKIILVMPTFRKWLRDIGRLKDPDDAFKETEYYKRWNSVLNNKKISELLKKHNMRIIFFPHSEMQKLAHNFHTKDTNIKIGKPGEYDIQDLLKQSSILLTDYSSVLFDYVYMGKTVIYYQFDKSDFFSKHYASSGKPYPFGDIFEDEKGFVDEIIETVDRKCVIKKKYADEAAHFYKFRDQKNCERVYKLIEGIKK